ncbi:MAG: hypothetical protein ACR2OR_10510 [Hyphomicrobiales bacterium]
MASSGLARDGYPTLESASISGTGSAPVIHVTSNNRQSWTNVRTREIDLSLRVDIRAKEGRIRRYFISPASLSGSADGELARFRTQRTRRVREVHTVRASLAALGISTNQLLTRCNNLLALGRSEQSHHAVKIKIPVKLRAVAGRRAENGERKTRSLTVWGQAPVILRCAALRPAEPVRVTELFLETPKARSGACPLTATVTAWIYANRPGTVKYRLVRHNGAATPYYTVKTEGPRDHAHFSRDHKLNIDRSANRHYKIEIAGQQVSSDWARVRVNCTHRQPQPAQGPFAVTDALTIIHGAGRRTCPHTAKITTRVRTNRPGPVKFRIVRSDGWMSPYITAHSELRDNGGILAIHHQDLATNISQDLNYRVVVHGHPIKSSWKRLRVDCAGRSTTPTPAPQNRSVRVSAAHLQILESKLPICPTVALFRASFKPKGQDLSISGWFKRTVRRHRYEPPMPASVNLAAIVHSWKKGFPSKGLLRPTISCRLRARMSPAIGRALK